MQRYFIELAYKGTGFHGWQIQENAITVQEELEKTLSLLLRENISVTGAGRTDTGVHASFFIAHFDSEKLDLHEDYKFIYRINQAINSDIIIRKVMKVIDKAHARFDAVSREYKYFISQIKDPFRREFCYEYYGKLDIGLMNEAAKIIMDYQDFESFCKLHSDVKTTICNVTTSIWNIAENQYVYTIRADRFLRNMVRAIVGTMFEVGKGKLTIKMFHEIIKGKNRSLAGASAPAKGLFLTNIKYPCNIFIMN